MLGVKIGSSLGRFKRPAPETIPEGPAPEAIPKGPVPEAIPEGFVSITQFLAEDIFVVGYPKSGNTWFQNLVSGVVYGVDPRFAPSALAHDLVPDLSYNKYYRRYATPMFFKSHDLPRAEFRRVVYLLRDGRDAMVSYRHYREAIEGVDLDFLKFVSPESQLYPCRWAEHVDAWMQDPYRAQMLVIKYEDLLREPERELSRFCQFVGISRGTNHLTTIAKAASFRTLRDKEARMGFGRPDHNFPPDTFFFRRGVAGSYKDEMPLEVLERFLEHAGDTLRRCGYDTGELGEENRRLAELNFHPQPYDQLASVYRQAGQNEDARRILSHKLTIERRCRKKAILRPLLWLYWACFNYGLSPVRALLTSAVLIAFGSIAVDYANQIGMLVVDTTPAATVVINGDTPSAATPIATANDARAEIPCGESISSILYAVDVFIPLLDLRQESRCQIRSFDKKRDVIGWDEAGVPSSTISERISAYGRAVLNDPRVWLIGKAIYAVLGWIVVSITILTISGILRYQVERE